MWPRVAEILIGLSLLTSPWVLAYDPPVNTWRLNGLVCGSAIVLLGVLSFWPASNKAHLAEIPIGLWILGFAYFGSAHPAPAVVQHALLAALFLLNFAIIPSQANLPPNSWHQFRDNSLRPTDARRGSTKTVTVTK
jgi:hypothetical protein